MTTLFEFKGQSIDLDTLTTEEKLELLHRMNVDFAKLVDEVVKTSKSK
jgi:hypothetical protein